MVEALRCVAIVDVGSGMLTRLAPALPANRVHRVPVLEAMAWAATENVCAAREVHAGNDWDCMLKAGAVADAETLLPGSDRSRRSTSGTEISGRRVLVCGG